MIEVTVPIAPQIEKGTIFIRIICVSQISRQVFDIDIEILVCRPITSVYSSQIIHRLKIYVARRSHHQPFDIIDARLEESRLLIAIPRHSGRRVADHSLFKIQAIHLRQSACFYNPLWYIYKEMAYLH